MSGKIADISAHQGNIDWAAAAPELDFVILRASIGTQDDGKYLDNVRGCLANGVPFAAYHYVQAGTASAARAEARYFYEATGRAAAWPMFWIADIEADAQTAETTEPVCVAFLEELRALGAHTIGLYINTRYRWAGAAIGLCDVMWIPHWGKNDGGVPEEKYWPPYPCDIWQYTSYGRVAGISTRVDLNLMWRGDGDISWHTERSNPPTGRDDTTMFGTNDDLARFAEAAYADKWVYWYGTCGYACTDALYQRKKEQYPSEYGDSREGGYRADIAAGRTCADCVGLIKAYFWTTGGTTANKYQSNGCPDKSANGMFALCEETGDIATIPDVPGVVVWKSGHIGVYVGNGYTVEMRGFAYDCVKRRVSEGPWVKWGKLPVLQYVTGTSTTTAHKLGDRDLRKGDRGDDVTALQNALLAMGYALPKWGADGDYGSETANAVIAFQRDMDIDATGIFDGLTYKALLAAQSGDTGEDGDTPDNGSAPAYVLIITGDEATLRRAQGAYGGTLAAVDNVAVLGGGLL